MPKKEKLAAVTKKDENKGEEAKKGGKERIKGKGREREREGKRIGSAGHVDDLSPELAALGLRIKDITGDGNCFFRALGDQLQGDEEHHVQLRARVVSYMVEHADDFAPFVEDDESFNSYVARMKKDGVWAGYMEVVASSRCLGANLTIYQAGQPRWHVIHHPQDSTPMLHLSYHDGQHYNSVRAADDFETGPPAPFVVRGAGNMTAVARPVGDGSWNERDERRVASSTACTDMALVRKALEEARGDIEAAIERVIEALAAAEPMPVAPAPTAAVAPATSSGEAAAAPAEGEPRGTATTDRDADIYANAGAPPLVEAAACTAASCPSVAAQGESAVIGGSGGGDIEGSGRGDTGKTSRDDRARGDGRSGDAAGQAGATSVDAATTAIGDKVAAAAAAAPSPKSVATPSLSVPAAKSVKMDSTRVTVGKAVARRAAAATTGGLGAAATTAASAPSNNKRCPCGSNKKYKACCGPAAAAAERRRAAAGLVPELGGPGQSGGQCVVVAQVAALVI